MQHLIANETRLRRHRVRRAAPQLPRDTERRRVMQHLIASDDRLKSLIHTARTTSQRDHPAYGNYIADVLDALAAYDWSGELHHADAVLIAAKALHKAAMAEHDMGAVA